MGVTKGKTRLKLQLITRSANTEILTSKSLKYDEDEVNPRIIAPDPIASLNSIDVLLSEHTPLLTKFEDDIMNSEDEPSPGLNGRLRPRKSAAPSPQAFKTLRKQESKATQDRPKRTSTPSRAAAAKTDDLANKSDPPNPPHLLCPYCDGKFASKQTVSNHVRRIHLSNAKQDSFINCLFCNIAEADPNDIIRHMVDSHPNQYFACLDCHTRFQSTSELAEHKLNVCDKQKEKPYRSKLRQKVSIDSKKSQNTIKVADDKDISIDNKNFPEAHRFNGVVISCELKPSQVDDEADIEENITTNLILPPSKTLGTGSVIEKNAVIVLDDIQWNKRMPTNFSFHNTDADQILSRLGVVHRSPRTGESTKKQWFKNAEELVQKFEKCFDTGFYTKVASNVHENLTKFLDGSFNFNPDPNSIIKTRKSKNIVVINTAEGFPILLASQQYSRNVFDGIPRTLAPKHKWKWENDKTLVNPDDIKQDSHVNKCIITLVSSLDIWTQLCMRRKFEDKFSIPQLEKKTEKQNAISKELKQILESRELPTSSQQVVKYVNKPSGESLEFPASLGLKPTASSYDMQPAVLSGEWVRPRCYVCCACGAQTRDSRGLSSHISTQHPNAQVQHYEIVGELLLNADILKHLYVPPSQMCNRTRPLRGFRECTKCKDTISLEDLHQHMLDCAGDTPAVRRKCRYRPFGVRRRRPRLPDNTIRKKIRKDIRSHRRQKTHMRQRPKIRSEVGDAETIRKMLADLPAKRHRVMVNPANPILRPRRKLDKQRNMIIMKRRSSEIAKNRKQRELKKALDANPPGSNIGEDENDNKSIKSDDDKPLKPKMKRVFTHIPRQSESLKRKVVINRAKRIGKMKSASLEKKVDQDQPADTSGGGSNPERNGGGQPPMDNSPERADVNGDPGGTREHSGRGSRSNRDGRADQRQGSSENPNGNFNNYFDRRQNVPLKHSIARLTSESEAHDRALQYHHLYMVQPPDNVELEMNQHVPSGQQRVFENEAVVTKLDKPPLHFNAPPPMDAFAFHRNKLPKPKKGLNDCIAMLKNKLVDPMPTANISHAFQCGHVGRLEYEAVVANQRAAALNYQLDMNSRPAEVFSRHQLMPDQYVEYVSKANMIEQNFAELPFHYMPPQRVAFDLPPPDSRVDPRFVRPTNQKQNGGQTKKQPVRRRSARTDKNTARNQDLNPPVPAVHYPVNVVTPLKVNSGQGRRSSGQNATVTANTAAAKRRASVSYNSARNQFNEYEFIMAQQRALEYRQQHISPEARLMEMAYPETYTQTQINKQNQLIAEQIIENYVNKKQLAISVDTNYANKMLTAAYAESLYGTGRQPSISPGNRYDPSKHTYVSPGRDNNMHLLASPGVRYDNSKLQTVNLNKNNNHNVISPEIRFGTDRHGAVPQRDQYNKQALVSPNSKGSQKQLSVSPGTSSERSHRLPVSPGSKCDNNKNLSISPGSRYEKIKRASISPNNKDATLSPENQLNHNQHIAISPRSRQDNVQRTANTTGNSYKNKRNAADGIGSHFDNSKYVANTSSNTSDNSIHDNVQHSANTSGNSYDNKRNAADVIGSHFDNNKYVAITSSNTSDNSIHDNVQHNANTSGNSYDNKRNAADVIGSHFDNNKYVANTSSNTSENSIHDNVQHTANTTGNSYDYKRNAADVIGSHFDNSKYAANTSSNTSDNSIHAAISPGRKHEEDKNSTVSPGSKPDNKQPIVSTGSNYISSLQGSTSPVRKYISKKQAAVAADASHNINKQAGMSTETHFINKKQAASSEFNHLKQLKQSATIPEILHSQNKGNISNKEELLVKDPYVEPVFMTKKAQAAAIESKLANKGQNISFTDMSKTVKSNLPCIGNNSVSESQALIDAETNYSKVQVDNSNDISLTEKCLSIQSQAAMSIENKQVNKNVVISENSYMNKNHAIASESYVNNPGLQCASRPNVLPERDPRKVAVECYTESKFGMRKLPPPYTPTSNNYKPNEIEKPLDLSKSTSNNTSILLKDDGRIYVTDNYDSFDLSNRGSEDNEREVVNLSIKMSFINLDRCSKVPSEDEITNDKRVSATDLIHKTRKMYNNPTELSVNRSTRNEEFDYEPVPNYEYGDQALIKNLPGKKTPPVERVMGLSTIGRNTNIPSDLSGIPQEAPLFLTKVTFKPKSLIANATDTSIRDEITPTSLSIMIHSHDSLPTKETISENCIHQTSVNECSYSSNDIYNPVVQKFDVQPVSNSNKPFFIDETSRSPKGTNTLLVLNDDDKSIVDEIAFNNNNAFPVSTITSGDGGKIFISTVDGSMNTVANPIMPVTMSYDSTTSVYTLANACISMAKEEPSNVASMESSNPLSDSILCIPSTTSVSSVSVYTKTDKTVKPSIIHTQDLTSSLVLPTCKTQVEAGTAHPPEKQICISSTNPSATLTPMEEQVNKTENIPSNNELDPETAKKIALLPKELVEILGTMPVDHRIQLLNVLPQYVSTSAPVSQNNVTDISAATVVNRGVSPAKISDFDIKPALGYSPVSSQIIQPITSIMPSLNTFEESKSLPSYHSAIESKSVDKELGKFEPSEQIPKIYGIDGNTVIDLTEDDAPINPEMSRVTEDSSKIIIPPKEPVSVTIPISKTNKQKVNDQTASLRAVRIKAPSERKKSVSIDSVPVKKLISDLVVSKVEVSEKDNKENFSELDKTLAIQQAEISSTQHNTTIGGTCKYRLAISPSSTESSSDESSKPVGQQSPVPTDDTMVEKLVDKNYEKPIPKTGMVSSSISTKVVNLDDGKNNLIASDFPMAHNGKNTSTESEILIAKDSSGKPLTKALMDDSMVLILENEEDSDDDISLAAIVKQKQRDQVNIDNIPKNIMQDENSNDNINKEPNEPDTEMSRKKKDKKGKKLGKKTKDILGVSTSLELKDVDSHLSNEEQADNVFSARPNLCVDQDPNEETDHEQVNEQSKKKTRKGRRVTDTSNVMDKQKTTKINKESEIDINKENDRSSELISNEVCIEENSTNPGVVSQTCNKNILNKENQIFNAPEIIKNTSESKYYKEFTTAPIIKICKCDDKISVFTTNSTKEVNKSKEKKKKYEQDLLHNENHDEAVFTTSELKEDLPSTSMTQPSPADDSRDEMLLKSDSGVDDVLTDHTKKGKKLARSKKIKNEEICKSILTDFEIDSSENVSNVENIVTPLRRSRRGKSFFLDSSSIEPEPIIEPPDEEVVEQKAPLTKKQRIFSKLLLDEGNLQPAAHSTPEKQDSNNIEPSDAVVDTTINVPDVSEIENVNELCFEKTKGTKRRINAQFPKKTKKKKSVDETTEEISQKLLLVDSTEENPNKGEVDTVSENFKDTSSELSIDLKTDADIDDRKDLNSIKNNNDNRVLSTEKRKNNNQISFDLSQSSKPKKSKLNKKDKMDFVDHDKVEDPNPSVITETKTACYNLPLPVRRVRSKSVVVKSSAYDPYDIDLEDMIEQNEMFRKKDKGAAQKTKNRTNKSADLSNKNTQKNIKAVRNEQCSKYELCFKPVQDVYDRGTNSDSDDSSKSDVPLQKYVDEKGKKIQEVEANLSKDKARKTQNKKIQKVEIKNAKSTPSNEVVQNVTRSQAEEELRSEQFMESFGFFSERKPRKSNLLASKKISETIHITNESDDMYFGFKVRTGKRNSNVDNKKSSGMDAAKYQPQPSTSRKYAPKRGRKTKKTCTNAKPCYCRVCKKEFRRSDNFLRHQMSILHVLKLAEPRIRLKNVPLQDEPNYLIAYKQYVDRFKKLTDILAEKKIKYPRAAARIAMPTREQILADVHKTVRDQQQVARGLSRDEALFLECCDVLREPRIRGSGNRFGMSGLDLMEKALNDLEINENMSDDGDCDSITARNILESEEVRYLENDLISGLQEAAIRNANIEYQNKLAAAQLVQIEQGHQISNNVEVVDQVPQENNDVDQDPQQNEVGDQIRLQKVIHQEISINEVGNEMQENDVQPEALSEQFSSPNAADRLYEQINEFDVPAKPRQSKVKKHYEIKEKMYPDIHPEDIDMFEDKFDKIKRKCRSQAAAAKQPQPIVDQTTSHKGRKKSEKKKGKRSSKKARHQSTHVPTKGALKGFDGIRVSIPTSDINMSAIVSVSESSPKKKRKSSSKKKRDKRDSESSSKYESDHRAKDSSSKNVDVYEFNDEDAELFEFRPSTLMERFKSISNNNKDTPNVSKFNSVAEENSSQGSASDGDDFVYMSDDYVGSDDETENSLLSCELGNAKIGTEFKKNSPQKRKDVIEKNAVMGKIFKHNAVRAEKKVVVPKESETPKANLDQLFDSLLEEEPNSSMLQSETVSPKDDEFTASKNYSSKSNASDKAGDQSPENVFFPYPTTSHSSSQSKTDSASLSTKRRSSSPSKESVTSSKKHERLPSKKYDSVEEDYGSSSSTKYDSTFDSADYGPSKSKEYHDTMPKDYKKSSPKSYDTVQLHKDDRSSYKNNESKTKKRNDFLSKKDDELFNSDTDDMNLLTNKPDEGISTSYDYNAEVYDQSMIEDETGVARQRARRKCTVGKQNVLAETWSSESEPDGGPPRPNSAESDISGVARKKKGKKKEGQQAGGRRGNNRHVAYKKHDAETRVSSRVSSVVADGAGSVGMDESVEGPSGLAGTSVGGSAAGGAGESAAAAAAAAAAMPAPLTSSVAGTSNVKGRPRGVAYYWSSEGDDEQEQKQQHGWIVCDSHKKLVTMLANAKGRKRNNDDKRHLVE